MKLYTTPSALSLFGGWSGGTCSPATPCSVVMNGNKSVTATFNPAPLLKIGGTNYDTLQAAYNAATSGAIIQQLEGQPAY